MSDSREGEREEAWTRADEDNDGDDQIDREQQQQQQTWVPLVQRKGKNKRDKDKKVNSSSNRRKAKANIFLLPPLRRFDEHLEGTKNKTTAATTRRSAPPFPYNGEDFGGSPSRYLCLLRSASSSPIHTGTAAASKKPSEVDTAKRKSSSYYDFMKSLIEKNDFYSPECNAHC